MAEKTIFLTGFPGFIGERLVAKLLELDAEARLIALAEESAADDARAKAKELDPNRIEVVAGDITDERLGLSEQDYERLRAEVTNVHHVAAVYDLGVEYDLAHSVNVEGTGNVLDLCRRAERLERLDYVSTAYVAGDRGGHVYEHELNLGQGFKNHYESTKFQAEVWVRSLMDDIPTAIYRPAIVVGDSETGETSKFDGPYYLLRIASIVRRRKLPLSQIGSEAPFNVVPVDLVVNAIARLSRTPEAIGETIHLADPEPLSSRELVEVLANEYAGKEPRLRLPPRMLEPTLRAKPVRKAFGGIPPESLEYLRHEVHFDTRRAQALLSEQDLRIPHFREYVEPIVEFFREHEDDPDYA